MDTDREVGIPKGRPGIAQLPWQPLGRSEDERWCVITLYHLAQMGTSHLKEVPLAVAAR